MKYWINNKIHNDYIVIPNRRRWGEGKTNFMEKRLNPYNFNSSVGYNLIFNFSTTVSDYGLLTEALRNKSMIKKNTITFGRAFIVSWTCPINIWKGLNTSMLPWVRTRPWFVVCLRNHGIILTILQWSVIVEYMNWQALPTT